MAATKPGYCDGTDYSSWQPNLGWWYAARPKSYSEAVRSGLSGGPSAQGDSEGCFGQGKRAGAALSVEKQSRQRTSQNSINENSHQENSQKCDSFGGNCDSTAEQSNMPQPHAVGEARSTASGMVLSASSLSELQQGLRALVANFQRKSMIVIDIEPTSVTEVAAVPESEAEGSGGDSVSYNRDVLLKAWLLTDHGRKVMKARQKAVEEAAEHAAASGSLQPGLPTMPAVQLPVRRTAAGMLVHPVRTPIGRVWGRWGRRPSGPVEAEAEAVHPLNPEAPSFVPGGSWPSAATNQFPPELLTYPAMIPFHLPFYGSFFGLDQAAELASATGPSAEALGEATDLTSATGPCAEEEESKTKSEQLPGGGGGGGGEGVMPALQEELTALYTAQAPWWPFVPVALSPPGPGAEKTEPPGSAAGTPADVDAAARGASAVTGEAAAGSISGIWAPAASGAWDLGQIQPGQDMLAQPDAAGEDWSVATNSSELPRMSRPIPQLEHGAGVQALLQELQARRQIEYYFALANLRYDVYLRSRMDEDGWVSLEEIVEFPKMKRLGLDATRAAASLLGSYAVEVSWSDPPRCRRRSAVQREAFRRLGLTVAALPTARWYEKPTAPAGGAASTRGRRRKIWRAKPPASGQTGDSATAGSAAAAPPALTPAAAWNARGSERRVAEQHAARRERQWPSWRQWPGWRGASYA